MKNNTFCKAMKCKYDRFFHLGENGKCTIGKTYTYGDCPYLKEEPIRLIAALAKSKYSRKSRLKHFIALFRRLKRIA
jgi:hypothetical protein